MANEKPERIQVVDSHTGGEPTRVVFSGGPDLGDGPLAERASRLGAQWSRYLAAVVNEPRGSEVLVGAWLCPPHTPDCDIGVIFFNNVGVLGMCGHGAIGLVATLGHLGKCPGESVRIDTPVGPVRATLLDGQRVAIENVDSWRAATGVTVDTPSYGRVTGDIAWGGNWFFLTNQAPCPIGFSHVDQLTVYALEIRHALNDSAQAPVGELARGAEIDHIEVFGPPEAGGDGRNFVLCPGGAYDRSPCGTGTSAKVACLAADGKLQPGETWRQESVIGSVFEASFEWSDAGRTSGPVIRPTIVGQAHVTSEATLLLDPADPFCWGWGRDR